MTVWEIIKWMFIANFFIVLLEFAYSSYKKDGIYSKNGTVNNMLSGIILNLVSARFFALYFLFFVYLYNFIHIDFQVKFSFLRFLFCLFFVDLMYYVFHYIHHKVLFFWSFHIVHHSDNKLNLSTALRISWFEQFYIMLFMLPVLISGFKPLEIFLAFYVLSEYQFYCHSQYFKLPRFFDWFLVTPHNHRIHHDNKSQHQNNNFGGVFSVWDRLFGTYTKDIQDFNPGTNYFQEDNLFRYQFLPILKFFKKIWQK